MTKDELIAFLKENLSLSVSHHEGQAYWDSSRITVKLFLGDEEIAEASDTMPDYERRSSSDW